MNSVCQSAVSLKPRLRRVQPVRVAALAFILLVVALLLGLRPEKGLQTWTSPPLDAPGRRLRALIPAAWRPLADGSTNAAVLSSFRFEAPDPLLHRLTNLILSGPPGGIDIKVTGQQPPDGARPSDIGETHFEEGGSIISDTYVARRIIRCPSAPLHAEIRLWHEDKRVLNAIGRAVCDSLRFE